MGVGFVYSNDVNGRLRSRTVPNLGKAGCALLDVRNVQYRPIAYYGSKRDIAIVLIAEERGDSLRPKDAPAIASRRKVAIIMATRRVPSSTSSERWKEIATSLKDKAYRDAFVEQEILIGIPFQIRSLRRHRGWSQKTLGEMATKPGEGRGSAQETISLWEKPGYGRLTLSTLLRLASAFDVGLMVRFAPYSELVDRAAEQDDSGIPSYGDDKALEASRYHDEPR